MLAVEHTIVRASIQSTRKRERGEESASLPLLSLQSLKGRVPTTIQRIGRLGWSRIVDTHLPPPPFSFGTEKIASRAYHKLNEIFLSCAIDPPLVSVHLCEAPGGFVQSTSEFALPGWRWHAISIEGGPDPRTNLLPMEKGTFSIADVYDEERCKEMLPERGACIVTADGAFEMDHSKMEEEHLPLLLSQTRIALHCIREGGTFVIKFFEGGEECTTRWIAWMTTLFETVGVIKPSSSRPTNSERYLVGRGFTGPRTILDVDKVFVVEEWTREVRERVLDRMCRDQANHLRIALCRAERVVSKKG